MQYLESAVLGAKLWCWITWICAYRDTPGGCRCLWSRSRTPALCLYWWRLCCLSPSAVCLSAPPGCRGRSTATRSVKLIHIFAHSHTTHCRLWRYCVKKNGFCIQGTFHPTEEIESYLLSPMLIKSLVRFRSPQVLSGVRTARQCCSILLNKWSRWGLVLKCKNIKSPSTSVFFFADNENSPNWVDIDWISIFGDLSL